MAGNSSSNGDAAPPVSAVAYRWNDKNVFHAIDEGRMPSDKLFDRPHYFAILDKFPVTHGHALLITKHKAATLLDGMPPEAAADTMRDLQVRHAATPQPLLLLLLLLMLKAGSSRPQQQQQQQQKHVKHTMPV
jgi:hypothetical protein